MYKRGMSAFIFWPETASNQLNVNLLKIMIHLTYGAGFSFEARGRTFCPVVSHSRSGTLMPIFEGFFFIIA